MRLRQQRQQLARLLMRASLAMWAPMSSAASDQAAKWERYREVYGEFPQPPSETPPPSDQRSREAMEQFRLTSAEIATTTPQYDLMYPRAYGASSTTETPPPSGLQAACTWPKTECKPWLSTGDRHLLPCPQAETQPLSGAAQCSCPPEWFKGRDINNSQPMRNPWWYRTVCPWYLPLRGPIYLTPSSKGG